MRLNLPLAATPLNGYRTYRWHELTCSGSDGPIRTYTREAIAALKTWQPQEPGSPAVIPSPLLALRLVEYRELVKNAKRGQLTGEDWNYAGSDPAIWELRMTYEGLFRFYFAEPKTHSDTMIALAAQYKDVDAADDVIHDTQTHHIERATAVFHREKDNEWGMQLPMPANHVQLDAPPTPI